MVSMMESVRPVLSTPPLNEVVLGRAVRDAAHYQAFHSCTFSFGTVPFVAGVGVTSMVSTGLGIAPTSARIFMTLLAVRLMPVPRHRKRDRSWSGGLRYAVV